MVQKGCTIRNDLQWNDGELGTLHQRGPDGGPRKQNFEEKLTVPEVTLHDHTEHEEKKPTDKRNCSYGGKKLAKRDSQGW